MKPTVISGGSEHQNPNYYSTVGGPNPGAGHGGNMNPTATATNNEAPNVGAPSGNNTTNNNNPHEQHTGYQNSRQFPPQFQTGFGFDTDDDDIFSDPALRARLNRIRDPFSFSRKRCGNDNNGDLYSRYFEDDPDFFSSFGSFGRRRAGQQDRDTGFFDNLPSQFRQYIPEGFGFPSSHLRNTSSSHTPRSAPSQQPQYPPQYYESFVQPGPGSPTMQPPPQQKPKLCDAAIQTEDAELQQQDAQQPGNLQQHGLRNTVDLGQKSPPLGEARGPRSQSAPPRDPNVAQNNQNQSMKNPSVQSINEQTGSQQTSQGTHPMTPQYNAYQQYQAPQFNQPGQFHAAQQKPKAAPQPQKQSSFDDGKNIRTIPIFVESRSEPPVSKMNAQPQQQQYVPPPPPPPRQSYQHPQYQQQFQQSEYPDYEYPPQNQFYPQQHPQQSQHYYQQPQQQQYYPQPQEQQQQHYPQHQPQQQQHYPQPQQQQYYQQPQQQHVPQQQQHHQQQNRPTPLNTQNIPPEQQAGVDKQIPPQTPQTAACITKIQAIQKDVLNLMSKVELFTGTRQSKEYMYLDEMLTRNLLKLDTIDTDGKESIRLARKEAIKCIQASINVLEAKADENSKAAQKSVMNANELERSSSKTESETTPKVGENPIENESTEQKVEEEIQQVPEENVAIPLPPPQSHSSCGEIQKNEISIKNKIPKEDNKQEKTLENDEKKQESTPKDEKSNEKENILAKDENETKPAKKIEKSEEIKNDLPESNNKLDENKTENSPDKTVNEEITKKGDNSSINKEDQPSPNSKENTESKTENVNSSAKDNTEETMIPEKQLEINKVEKDSDSNKEDDAPKKTTKVIRLVRKKKIPSSTASADKGAEKGTEKSPSSSDPKDAIKENEQQPIEEVKKD